MKSSTRILGLSKRKKRLLSIVIMAVIFFYLLFSFLFSDLGLVKYVSKRREYNRLREEISSFEAKNRRLREEVGALKTDPYSIEALARRKLGLVKEGEIIYQFLDENKDKN